VTRVNIPATRLTPPRSNHGDMNQFQGVVDEVLVTHTHGDAQQEMRPVDDDRVDGLRVREYACSCGFVAAVLSRVEDEQPGTTWPYAFQAVIPPA
jgi:hypothetical protein